MQTTDPVPDLCDVDLVHEDRVREALGALPEPGRMDHMAEVFRACGDPTRLKLLLALAEAELCVCDLAVAAGASQSGVSHHLRLLRTLRLVRSRRDGRMIYYRLDDEHVLDLLRIALAHQEH